ncbi:uncharacterized protein LOC132195889 [Neocloeon triangulifer]|uniref:uncharacterized protein LOC132195889 n=1 Tax=Neocloeon triangulifer TaxID=2078957 RepID=UPI00286EB93C|nr:uncharacterized protein LOC132195889 [Neocloeon triangulifer]
MSEDEPLESDDEEANYANRENISGQNTLHDFDELQRLAEELLLKDPLYAGCDLTLIETLIRLVTIYKKHSLPKSALGEIISLFFDALPKPCIFPSSKHNFFKIINQLTPGNETPVVSYSCSRCYEPFTSKQTTICPKCESSQSPAVCVTNDIKTIIRHMFECRGLATLFEKNDNNLNSNLNSSITDVMDGIVSKRIEKSSKYDLYLIHNTDGFPFAKSNKKQFWPNFLAIGNIPPKLRSKFIVLVSICFTPNKPNLLRYMIPFAENMLTLGTEGFTWRHPLTKTDIKSRLFIVSSTVDAQARAPLMNMNFYNAEYGCSFCEIECTSRGEGQGPGKLYPYEKYGGLRKPLTRSRERSIQQANLLFGAAREERVKQGKAHPEHEKGVKGHCPFVMLPHFDVINSFSPDYLHSCLIGVTKRWTKHILNSQNHSKPFYIGLMSHLVDERIKKIRVPSFVTRLPRGLDDISFWKASEYRNWLLFYSLPCLKGILNDKFLLHHALLVEAIYTLDKSVVSQADLQLSNKLLNDYCSQYGSLYGRLEETFNLHMLLHYTNSVEHIGPLWASSTFIFENANGTMRTSVQGKNNIALELVNTSQIHSALYTLNHIYALEDLQPEKYSFLGAKIPFEVIAKEDQVCLQIIKLCNALQTDVFNIELALFFLTGPTFGMGSADLVENW